MAAGPGYYSTHRTYNDGEVDPRLTHVCHCVLVWVFDVGQDVKVEQGRNKNTVISITLPLRSTKLKLLVLSLCIRHHQALASK